MKIAFLDRDGVINEDKGYVGRPEDFMLLPDAAAGLAALAEQGYSLAIVTNQSGIGRGYFSAADYQRVTRRMVELLAEAGVTIAHVAHCPHRPEEACACRKPRPGMILETARLLAADLAQSILIGDKPGDIEAGRAAGVGRCFLIGPGGDAAGSDGVFPDLLACARTLARA